MGTVEESFGLASESRLLDDLTHNLPSSSHLLRSLSKSKRRDSTQKQPPPPRAQVKDRAEDDISVQPSTNKCSTSVEHTEEHPVIPLEQTKKQTCSPIEKLPSELLELILGYVGGQLGSAGTGRRLDRNRNWNDILRHPRGKSISSLALVSSKWRDIVQERLFRHSKASPINLFPGIAKYFQSGYKERNPQ